MTHRRQSKDYGRGDAAPQRNDDAMTPGDARDEEVAARQTKCEFELWLNAKVL